MSKNIIICCDGTGNQLDEAYSNVVKLYSVIRKVSATDVVKNQKNSNPEDLREQVIYYDPGVGTLPNNDVKFRLSKKIKTWTALGLGLGLEDNASEAYSFLMQNYEDGDHVYLFGFSRGAYTVRVLAGLIKVMGLLEKNCQHLIPYAWTYYRECFREDLKKVSARFKLYFSRNVEIHFVGVWDTVSSVGLVGGPKSYPFTRDNDHVLHLRHAVSIDERRRFYRQNLFLKIKDNVNLKQVWFAGVHSDVGGSYPLNECGLSQITLRWMIREAGNAGLIFDQQMIQEVIPAHSTATISTPDALADAHDALTGAWKAAEYLPKRDRLKGLILPRGQWRRMFVGPTGEAIRPTLHESVIERMMKRKDYRPGGLEGYGADDYDVET